VSGAVAPASLCARAVPMVRNRACGIGSSLSFAKCSSTSTRGSSSPLSVIRQSSRSTGRPLTTGSMKTTFTVRLEQWNNLREGHYRKSIGDTINVHPLLSSPPGRKGDESGSKQAGSIGHYSRARRSRDAAGVTTLPAKAGSFPEHARRDRPRYALAAPSGPS